MNGKRGLSPVISSVLIILLVIAAVAIIAAVVLPTVERTSEKIGEAGDCFSIDLDVLSCEFNVSGNDDIDVSVERGPGDVSLERLKIVVSGTVYESDSADVTPVSGTDPPQELGTTLYRMPGDSGSEVSVAAVLVGGSACDPTPKVSCS